MSITFSTTTDLYSEVQQFYAGQMQKLDGGDFEGYAATFTADGEFSHTPGSKPARTRTGIIDSLHEFHRRFENDPVQRRHWFNMISLNPRSDGTIHATFYALVITTRPGGKPDMAPHCVVRDVLVRQESGLLNRSRRVEHDQLR